MSFSTSTDWEHWNPDLLLVCPFESSHVITAKRYQRHVIKCRQNHPDKDFVECPFNAKHVMLRSDLRHHLSQCKFRRTVDEDVALDHEKDGNLYFKGNTQVPSYISNLPEPEEDWDQEVDDQGHLAQDNFDTPQQQSPAIVESLSSEERTNIKHLMKRKALANQNLHSEQSFKEKALEGRKNPAGQQTEYPRNTSCTGGQNDQEGCTGPHYNGHSPVMPSYHPAEVSGNSYGNFDLDSESESGAGRWGNTRLRGDGLFSQYPTRSQRQATFNQDDVSASQDWTCVPHMDQQVSNQDFDRGFNTRDGMNHRLANGTSIHRPNDASQTKDNQYLVSDQCSPVKSSKNISRARGRGNHSGTYTDEKRRPIGRGIGLLTLSTVQGRPGLVTQSQNS